MYRPGQTQGGQGGTGGRGQDTGGRSFCVQITQKDRPPAPCPRPPVPTKELTKTYLQIIMYQYERSTEASGPEPACTAVQKNPVRNRLYSGAEESGP